MLICFSVYLSVHFLLYALLLRRLVVFHRELPIFLYHALPASLVVCIAIGNAAADSTWDAVIAAALILAVQGVYSLSFLELWSLTQGGYSIRILARMETEGQSGVPTDLQRFGATKKHDRLQGLRSLKLVRPAAGGYGLTSAGHLAAGFLNTIRWIANVRESG